MSRYFDDQKRSTEAPMDFEWQTAAPRDPMSPFPQFNPNQGHRGGFASPSHKSSFAAASSTPAPPFRNPSFITPRKPFDQNLFSDFSGAESSPADTADTEDTPDLPKGSPTMTAFPHTTGTIRQPIFTKYGAGYMGSSPGRAELRGGKYGSALVKKVRKRKRIDKDTAMIRGYRGDSESDSDGSRSRPSSRDKKNSRGHGNGNDKGGQWWFASMFNYIDAHPNLPSILSFYAQMIINFFVAALTIWGMYSFWTTIQADVDKAADEARAIFMKGVSACTDSFTKNGCHQRNRVPALDGPCDEWEHCMNQDPNNIGRARVSAKTFAEIFNSFIEPISFKTMIFITLLILLVLFVNNMAFGAFRAKAHLPQPQPFFPPPQNFHWGQPTQTPRHSSQEIGYDSYTGRDYPEPSASHTPARSPSKRERSRSPSKKMIGF